MEDFGPAIPHEEARCFRDNRTLGPGIEWRGANKIRKSEANFGIGIRRKAQPELIRGLVFKKTEEPALSRVFDEQAAQRGGLLHGQELKDIGVVARNRFTNHILYGGGPEDVGWQGCTLPAKMVVEQKEDLPADKFDSGSRLRELPERENGIFQNAIGVGLPEMLQQIDRGVRIPRQSAVNLLLRGIREGDKLLNRCGGIRGNSDEIGKTFHGHSHDRITRVSRGNCHTRRFFMAEESVGRIAKTSSASWTYGLMAISPYVASRNPERVYGKTANGSDAFPWEFGVDECSCDGDFFPWDGGELQVVDDGLDRKPIGAGES